MSRVKAFTIRGARCWFWSGDHRPPHFHIEHEGGDWSARVFFSLPRKSMIQDIRSRKKDAIPAAIRKRLEDLVVENRDRLMAQWEEIHGAKR